MEEVWKDIKGYEGLYQVSSLGKVKNLKYNKILKRTINKGGYMVVSLSKNNKSKKYYVHRLVAQTFIENNIVNHKNFNKLDNRVENLEWCSQEYNAMHSYLNGRTPLPPAQEPKRIIRNDGKIYNSIEEAGKDMKINPSIICNQLKGRQKTVKGYVFTYLK